MQSSLCGNSKADDKAFSDYVKKHIPAKIAVEVCERFDDYLLQLKKDKEQENEWRKLVSENPLYIKNIPEDKRSGNLCEIAIKQEGLTLKYKDSIVVDNLWVDSVKIDLKLAEQLRELFKNFSGGKMSAELVLDTMQKCSEPKKPKARKLNADIYSKYFDEDESDDYVNSIIDEALQMYFQNEKE